MDITIEEMYSHLAYPRDALQNMRDYLRALMARLRGLLGIQKANLEFDNEIQAHLHLLTERYIRQGMTRDEATAAAWRQFGNITMLKEANREMRGIRFIETVFQDLRFGLWLLRRNPGFTFVAVLTLALGIGANTAIFSVVNAVLLRPLRYQDPDRLVMVSHYRAQKVEDFTAGGDFLRWREAAKSFEHIAAFQTDVADLSGSGEPERLAAGFVSADLFATLGVSPALGRAFTAEEDTAGGPPVVILSDSLWRRRFGGDPSVIGQALKLQIPDYKSQGDLSRTVVGIMPPGFRFPRERDLWLPLALNVAKEMGGDEGSGVSVIARLKPGLAPEAAGAELSLSLEQLRQAFPGNYSTPDLRVRVIRLSESLVENVQKALLILFVAVTFVLLIACANVTNLLLARSATRQKEMAIRAAVGAGRLRLVRQLLTESLMLSVIASSAGLIVAKWGVKLLIAMSPEGIPHIGENGPASLLDGHVLGFTSMIAVLVSLITGIIPALQATKVDVNETIKSQSTAIGHARLGGKLRILPALMIAELALALVLLVGAGLMINSFLRLLAVPKGFNPDGVLTLNLAPAYTKYPAGSPQRLAYFQEILARVKALPGIQSASLTTYFPLSGSPFGMERWKLIEGREGLGRGNEVPIELNHSSIDYLQTMGIQLRAGRSFTAEDGNGASRVAIVNETLVRSFLPNENPIGHRLVNIANPRPTIVGVVGDARHSALDKEIHPEIYLPYPQYPDLEPSLNLALRVATGQNNPASLSSLATAIRNQVLAVEPNEPVDTVLTMDERLSNSLAERRFQTLLLSIFAAIALVIASVGIYGVISYGVNQRKYEIGIRMALGAQAGDVMKMVIWRGLSLALIGVALGLAAAFALTRVIKSLLFDVSATDPATFALIAIFLIVVALIASFIPARRATKVDPLQALRHE
jgi:putative ABC transport system permease protein